MLPKFTNVTANTSCGRNGVTVPRLGAISIVTHDPGDQFRFVGSVTTGSYSLINVKGTVDVPIVW